MNAQQAENLRILIRHMESLKRTLDMDRYFNECGTPACALGEACALGIVPTICSRNGEKVIPWDVSDSFGFGEHGPEGKRLFGLPPQNHWRRRGVTPQEWAAEARKVLAENGYAMDDTWAADKVKQVTTPQPEAIRAYL